MPTNRVEAFSDGVFAVAATLLVLDLHVPGGDRSLFVGLADDWPQFAAFALAFVVIGIMWVNHHRLIGNVEGVDRVLLFLNLLLLMSIVLVPFATALFAANLARGGEASQLAAALFSGSMVFCSISFSALYSWSSLHGEIVRAPHAAPGSLRSVLRFGLGLFAYSIALGLSFVISALLILGIHAVVAAYYVVDQVAGTRG